MTLPHPLGSAPTYEIQTYSSRPFIWYTTWLPFKKTLTFCTWWPCSSPRKAPKYETRYLLVETFIWYTTWLPLKNFNFLNLMILPHTLGSAPKYEIRNLLVKTFHLIYYMTTFKKNLNFFALDDLAPTPRMCPKIWNPKPTRRDLSIDILHDYL
jgi:hypothetical protein